MIDAFDISKPIETVTIEGPYGVVRMNIYFPYQVRDDGWVVDVRGIDKIGRLLSRQAVAQ